MKTEHLFSFEIHYVTFAASPSRMESSVTAAAPSQRLNEASIVYRPGEKSFKTHPERKNSQLKHESKLASSARSPLPEDQRLTEQRLEDISGGRREGFTAHDFETTSGRRSSYFSAQGTTPKKNLSADLERPKGLRNTFVSVIKSKNITNSITTTVLALYSVLNGQQ